VCALAAYYMLVVKQRQDPRVLAARRLFLLMDDDSSGFLDVDELRQMFTQLAAHVPPGHKGEVVMKILLSKLPLAPTAAPAAAPTAAPAEAAAPAGQAAAPAPTTASLDQINLEGSLNRHDFEEWILSSTNGQSKKRVLSVLEKLVAYAEKEKGAERLFRMWDADGSGTLETAEIEQILAWFQEHVQAEDVTFESIWEETDGDDKEDAAADEAKPTASMAPERDEEVAQPPLQSDSSVSQFWKQKVSGDEPETFESWKEKLKKSLSADELEDEGMIETDAQGKITMDIVGFKKWLVRITMSMSTSTFEQVMAKLGETVNKQLSAKQLFHVWDADGSGALDMTEVKDVLKWFHSNVPDTALDFFTIWDVLTSKATPDGKIDLAGFEDWLINVTNSMQPPAFKDLVEKLQEHLRKNGTGATTALVA